MRSAVFVLIFAMCLVACGCAASTGEEEKPEEQKAKEGTDSSTVTTTTVQQPSAPQPKQDNSKTPDDPEVPKVSEDSGPASPNPGKPPTPQSELDKQSSAPPQQQQQQLQLSHTNTNQGTAQSQIVTGDPITTGHDAALTSTNKDATHNAQHGTPEKDKDTHTAHQEHHVTDQDNKNKLSSSSHSTEVVAERAQEKQETSTTPTDNTPDGIKSPGTTHTEGTQTEQEELQVSERITTDDKTPLSDIPKQNGTPAREPTQSLSRETDHSPITGSHVNRQAPSTASTTHTADASLQDNQDRTKTSLQTSPDGVGLSINKHTPKEGVNTPSAQQAKQQNTDNSGRQQSQAATQRQPNSKNKESENGTTHSANAAAQGDQHSVSPAKPAATTIAVADDVATSKRTTFTNSAWSSVQKPKGDNSGNKDTTVDKTLTISTSTVMPTDYMQTSVSSTSESTKVDSAAPQTHIPKLTNALQSLGNNDSSIGITPLSALTVLAALVVMSVVPAS